MSNSAQEDSKNSVDDKLMLLVSKHKIFFGHQSVGGNVIQGIQEIAAKLRNSDIVIKETRDANDFSEPVFAHSGIGKNKDPYLKIDDFKKLMESGIGEKVDLAFFKFCFVDVDKSTDIERLFSAYSATMDYLALKFPRVRFIHFTVPLTTIGDGLKSRIKKVIGIKIESEEDNRQRTLFNALVLNKYKNVVFDIAKLESTDPLGDEKSVSVRKVKVNFLLPGYTQDGGHLNASAREIIAKDLLKFIGKVYQQE